MENTDNKPGWFSRRCSCKDTRTSGQWLAIGIAIGAGIGVALDDIAVGIGVGAGIGIALGAGMSRRRGNCKPSDKSSDE